MGSATHLPLSLDEVPEKLRVLIADDDPAMLKALSIRCQGLGLKVSTAPNGVQAVLKAKQEFPDLVILDISMPEADGFRVCEWLLSPTRRPTQVIVLTGHSDLETVERCESIGAFYVPKNANSWPNVMTIIQSCLDIEPKPASSEQPTSAERANRLPVQAKGNKVLVVEDDLALATALLHRLRKCGAVALHASNGIAGYRLAVRERPDVIVADYVMPEGGGHYLLWRLKSTAATARIPVFIISGQPLPAGTEFPLERSLDSGGAIEFVRKPLDMDVLLSKIAEKCQITFNKW